MSSESRRTPNDEPPKDYSAQSGSPPDAVPAHEVLRVARETLTERVTRSEAWMIWLTAALALVALCGVIVAALQWAIMARQLTEMHDGGLDTQTLAKEAIRQANDTQELAVQAKEQVTRTEELAASMKSQADYTSTIAKQAIVQAEAAKIEAEAGRVAAQAAVTSAKVNQSQLNLTQRPWLTATAEVSSPLACGQVSCSLSLHVGVTNSGHTLAKRVFALVGAATLSDGDAAARHTLCNSNTDSEYAMTLFPGETTQDDPELKVSRAVYSLPSGDIYLSPLLCIAYESSFNGARYWTAYTYDLRANSSPTHDNKYDRFPGVPGENGKIDNLLLRRLGYDSEAAK